MAKEIAIKSAEFFIQDIQDINITPTAYDIDKVVEELGNECISPNDYPGYVVDLEKAIEIVKQGKEQK